MRFLLAAVGRPRDGALAAAIEEYETRAARYWPLSVAEVREERAAGGVSAETVVVREGERLAERAPLGAFRVVCDPDGRTMTSPQLAQWLQDLRERARDVAFFVGGAYGLSPQLVTSADARLSLSAFTFPHELARLVLAEQLYRAGTIVRGEPYHK